MQDRGVVWRNGQLVPFADATAHVLSHMAARGSQIFDVLLVTRTELGPSAVGLRAHVTRFLRSAELMGMVDTGEVAELERAVAQTVFANADTDASADGGDADRERALVVKLVAAWAEEADGMLPSELRPTVYVLALPYAGERPADELGRPARVRTATMPKVPAEILPPSMKVAAGYTPGVRQTMAARAEGFDQVVFRDGAGDLAESTTLSMLVVTGGRIVAPPLDSVLDSITRRIVLDAAHHLELPVEVRAVGWAEVLGADELLLTSTNNPVQPVAALDDVTFDAPGPITAELGRVMGEILRGRHPLSETWLTPLQDLTA